MNLIRKKLRKVYLRIITAKGAPHQVAGGVAVGVFWGLSPLWSLQMVLALVTATVLNVNRVTAVICVHLSNPATLFIYWFTYWVGDLLLIPVTGPSKPIAWSALRSSLGTFPAVAEHVLARLLLGGVVVGLIAGASSYALTLRAITRYRQAVQKRRERLRATLEAAAPGGKTADQAAELSGKV